MPKICCGLEEQNYDENKKIINEIFKATHLQIFIHWLSEDIN